jgi:hypothetical protein
MLRLNLLTPLHFIQQVNNIRWAISNAAQHFILKINTQRPSALILLFQKIYPKKRARGRLKLLPLVIIVSQQNAKPTLSENHARWHQKLLTMCRCLESCFSHSALPLTVILRSVFRCSTSNPNAHSPLRVSFFVWQNLNLMILDFTQFIFKCDCFILLRNM